MLKSCQYCGRIHDSKFDCGKKPKLQNKKPTHIDKFRWTKIWQNKRKEIRERDKQVCQICIRQLYNYSRQYETDDLSVHHIIPLYKDWDKRLDNDNLITLCLFHHEMAECGEIYEEELLQIAKEQEEKSTPLD